MSDLFRCDSDEISFRRRAAGFVWSMFQDFDALEDDASEEIESVGSRASGTRTESKFQEVRQWFTR